MLELQGVDVCRGEIQVLWSVSLRVQEKKVTALLGSNGAGKTTLLMAVCGLLRPAKGSISLQTREIHKEAVHRIVELGVSMVPEGRRLFPEMSVLENLQLGAFTRQAREKVQETLEEVFTIFPALKSRRTQLAGTLSGGEQQMVSIGRALMSHPRLLLLDELSWGLAPVVVNYIGQTIKEINRSRGLTIFIVEQNVSMALKMADYGYILENGRIVGEGDAKELLTSEQVSNAYLGVEDL